MILGIQYWEQQSKITYNNYKNINTNNFIQVSITSATNVCPGEDPEFLIPESDIGQRKTIQKAFVAKKFGLDIVQNLKVIDTQNRIGSI